MSGRAEQQPRGHERSRKDSPNIGGRVRLLPDLQNTWHGIDRPNTAQHPTPNTHHPHPTTHTRARVGRPTRITVAESRMEESQWRRVMVYRGGCGAVEGYTGYTAFRSAMQQQHHQAVSSSAKQQSSTTAKAKAAAAAVSPLPRISPTPLQKTCAARIR